MAAVVVTFGTLPLQPGSVNSDAANIELLQSAVTAEVQKLASGTDKAASAVERDMTDQMVRHHRGCCAVFTRSSWCGQLCTHQAILTACAREVQTTVGTKP